MGVSDVGDGTFFVCHGSRGCGGGLLVCVWWGVIFEEFFVETDFLDGDCFFEDGWLCGCGARCWWCGGTIQYGCAVSCVVSVVLSSRVRRVVCGWRFRLAWLFCGLWFLWSYLDPIYEAH